MSEGVHCQNWKKSQFNLENGYGMIWTVKNIDHNEKKKNIVREEQIIDLFIIINPKGIRPCRLLEE